jgi:hypothetical protein
MTRWATALVLLTWAAQNSKADDAWRFRWQTGQVLTYRVEQQTQAAEVTSEGKSETKTKLTLSKRWQVQSVDAAGVATLQHSVVALRMETATPGGETIVFDSADLDRSDARLREQMSKYVGVPIATLRVNALGKVIEVKESKFGPASRFEAEPPFLVVLPDAAVKQGQRWERAYQITQEPPQGTGEKYDAAQACTCTKVDAAELWVALTTVLKTQPMSLGDRVPLLQMQPEGTIVFDVKNGRLHWARLKVEKELKGHAGEGSSYSFTSTYTEQFVPAK